LLYFVTEVVGVFVRFRARFFCFRANTAAHAEVGL
jgi:hypothetical protein